MNESVNLNLNDLADKVNKTSRTIDKILTILDAILKKVKNKLKKRNV